jgi:hypothetical protein
MHALEASVSTRTPGNLLLCFLRYRGTKETPMNSRNIRLLQKFHTLNLLPQVCKLPPAWGYQHAGLERYITSFPVVNWAGSCTRILHEEADGERIALWKSREDARAYLYGILKLGAGIRVRLCHVQRQMCHACDWLHAPGKFRLVVRFHDHEAAVHPCRHVKRNSA